MAAARSLGSGSFYCSVFTLVAHNSITTHTHKQPQSTAKSPSEIPKWSHTIVYIYIDIYPYIFIFCFTNNNNNTHTHNKWSTSDWESYSDRWSNTRYDRFPPKCLFANINEYMINLSMNIQSVCVWSTENNG